MRLEGSCHCGAVQFSLTSRHPVPYQRCYCSICRKTQGGGGYAINLGGDAASLVVEGREHVSTFHAHIRNPGEEEHISTAERTFCRHCGSALWLFSPEWPELIHPFASAIDTALPEAPATTHIMLEFKTNWVRPRIGAADIETDRYPDESIAEWHRRHGMEDSA
jgi:hypothetical protein